MRSVIGMTQLGGCSLTTVSVAVLVIRSGEEGFSPSLYGKRDARLGICGLASRNGWGDVLGIGGGPRFV